MQLFPSEYETWLASQPPTDRRELELNAPEQPFSNPAPADSPLAARPATEV